MCGVSCILVYLPFGNNVDVGDGDRWNNNFPTSATAVLTLPKAIVARERAPRGVPNGAVGLATNVRAITTDAAGNQSAPFANDFIPGAVDPAGTATSHASATPALNTANWAVSSPSAGVNLCNGQGATACATGNAKSVTYMITAKGVTGSYNNPFGAAGKISGYRNIDGNATYYDAEDVWQLLGNVDAASATMTDDGTTHTYTWTSTLASRTWR